MSETLYKVFEDFLPQKHNQDCDTKDLYWKVAKDVDIDRYVGYKELRDQKSRNNKQFTVFEEYLKNRWGEKSKKIIADYKNNPSFLHFIISVNVSAGNEKNVSAGKDGKNVSASKDEDKFVPFFSIIGNDKFSKKLDEKKCGIEYDLRGNVISKGKDFIDKGGYTYADFLSKGMNEFSKKFGLENISSCAFEVSYGEEYEITECRFHPGDSSYDLGSRDYYSEEDTAKQRVKDERSVNEYLKEKLLLPQYSFVKFFYKFYHDEFGIKKLRYSFFNIDADLVGESKYLAKMMIISTVPGEVTFFLNNKLHKIRDVIGFIRARYVYDLIQANRYEATKSAKAAIMSRNMSHNLGSHVMAYLKHHLSSVQDMLNNKVLVELFNDKNELNNLLTKANEYNPTISDTDSVALPFLVGLGQFISYLQERQDFIATIATDYVPYFSSINFKDFVYDELNNDKRYERHPDRKNLRPDNILLGNIARSEGLGRITCPTNNGEGKASLRDIVLKFGRAFTGDPVEKALGMSKEPIEYYGNEVILKEAAIDLNRMRVYDICLPGGIVGRQAIFSIFENVIRNAAKHGNWREKGKLEIAIDIFDADDVRLIQNEIDSKKSEDVKNEIDNKKLEDLKERLRIDDNTSEKALSLYGVLKKYYCNENYSDNDLYFVTLTDNLSFSLNGANGDIAPKAISQLRKALIEEYIDGSGQMNNSNKGLKEMRISAAWLRDLDDVKDCYPFDSNNYNKEDGCWGAPTTNTPPILYVRISKDKDGDCHLQYIFCLVRPQKVAFISDDFTGLNDETQKSETQTQLRKHFWHAFNISDYKDHKNKSFEFVVYDGNHDTNDENYKLVRSMSSSRFICLSDINDKALDDAKEAIVKDNVNSTKLHDAELAMYKHLSGWDGVEKIHINDERTRIDERYNNVSPCEYVTFDSTDTAAKYRYMTHLEDKIEFEKYVATPGERCFVYNEGITGNNSTDRLIRNEKIDDVWFFKHLYAMKQRVAIFDERIFSKTFGLEESDLSRNRSLTEQDIVKEKKKEIIDSHNLTNFLKIHLNRCKTITDLNEFCGNNRIDVTLEPFNQGSIKGKEDLSVVTTKNHLGATYLAKGVFVFSIMKSNEDPSCFNLYGGRLNKDINDTFSDCIKYACIRWKDGVLDITPYDGVDKEMIQGFDTISIHQGLLDKLYSLFDIKNDNQAREDFTRDFYLFFSKQKETIDFAEKNKYIHHFMPGMIIHSGRSKPSVNDMPQKLPFIPFSAIEHAVLDCKYSLVELLNSARYE